MIIPNLMVADIAVSAAFYRDVLGFTVLFSVSPDRQTRSPAEAPAPGDVFAIVERDGDQIMLQTAASLAEDLPVFRPDMTPALSGAVYIRDVDPAALRPSIPDAIILKDIETTWYGMKEMHLQDPDGYVISIGLPSGPPPSA